MKRKKPLKSRRPRRAPSESRGLRVQLEGTRSLDDLRMMLLQAVVQLDELGIQHAKAVNLYLTPATSDGTPLTAVANGQPITSLKIKEPYRSAADEHGL